MIAAPLALPGQFTPIRRYFDPATEAEVLALSDPANASFLPHSYNRCASSRNGFIVYSTETTNGFQALRLELKGGVARPLTAAQALEPKSLALSPDDKTLYYADGDRLFATPVSGPRPREIYKASSPGAFERGLSLSDDGAAIALFDQSRLVLVSPNGAKPTSRTIAELEPSSEQPEISKSGHILYRAKNKSIYLANPGPSVKPKRLPLEGDLGPAIWNPDGRSFLFLRVNQGAGIANGLFEYSLDTGKESLVGKTSQFVHFNRNADSSVFVGASGSKAQPFVLLMLRVTRREFALCEHKSSDATQVAPIFSPSSQRIYFQSDRLGKPAIFSVGIEKLVERTEQEEGAKKNG